MENHTWRVCRDRAESLIHDHSMVDPPTKDFQQSPLLLIAKAYEKVQTHKHKFMHTNVFAVQIELSLRSRMR